jgi:putative Ca2+/H+ antiporter (TMEM165/GDT1 family)
MDAFLISTAVVAIAEIGDKTQLLAILLAARFKRPWPILAGILVATLANHALAALAGALVAGLVQGVWFRAAVGIAFIAMAIWALIPDKEDEAPAAGEPKGAWGVFLATTIAFFLVEIGDKTQVATIALAARFETVLTVAAGTTLGMMIANAPAVWLGERAATVLPLRTVRIAAALIFLVLGAWALAEALFA